MNKWDKIFSEGVDFTPLNQVFLNNLLSFIKNKIDSDPKTMIDLGCGTGDTLIKFSKKGLNVEGMDSSEVALEKAKESLSKEGIDGVKLSNVDLNNLVLDKKYDLILCKLTYAFIDDKESFLEEVKKGMTHKSVFILITPVLHKGIEYLPEDKPGIAVDIEETNEILIRHFSNSEIFHHNYYRDKIDETTFVLMK